jgi:hypothetical protein
MHDAHCEFQISPIYTEVSDLGFRVSDILSSNSDKYVWNLFVGSKIAEIHLELDKTK